MTENPPTPVTPPAPSPSGGPASAPDGALDRPGPLDRDPTAQWAEIQLRERTGAKRLGIAAAALGLAVTGGIVGSRLATSNLADYESTFVAAAEIIPTAAVTEDPVESTTEDSSAALTDVSDIAAATVDSVVYVEASVTVRGRMTATSSGSGVIVSEVGTIVTNAHVVDGAQSITVELTNGQRYEATVLAEDSDNDTAVLEIEATGLSPIEIGSTLDLVVGEPVIAIGNPLGLEGGPSVSTGIVSALDRVIQGSDRQLDDIIQTDAAISEGSSGGALLDADGLLIGITTAVGVSSVGVEGIAFAVPIETVSAVLGSLATA